jgi:CDP-6-deoxy-D-xylo-4-hexulose-3-dehydrase
MQAAIGCAQLEKIDLITEARRRNWATIYEALEGTPGLILPVPQNHSQPSWFGFIISVDEKASFTRNELTSFLENKKIQTRNLFAGNLIKHPAFDEMRRTKEGYRVIGNLQNTDFIMNNSFWIGVYPGMTPDMLSYMTDCIKEFIYQHKK